MTRRNEIKPWHIVLALLVFCGAIGGRLFDLLSRPPEFAGLTRLSGELSAPVSLVRNPGRNSSGPYGALSLGGREYRLGDLCFLSNCTLPPAVAALRPGEVVKLWVDGNIVWQIGTDETVPVTYAAVRLAAQARKERLLVVVVPMSVVAILAVPLLVSSRLRRRSGA